MTMRTPDLGCRHPFAQQQSAAVWGVDSPAWLRVDRAGLWGPVEPGGRLRRPHPGPSCLTPDSGAYLGPDSAVFGEPQSLRPGQRSHG